METAYQTLQDCCSVSPPLWISLLKYKDTKRENCLVLCKKYKIFNNLVIQHKSIQSYQNREIQQDSMILMACQPIKSYFMP